MDTCMPRLKPWYTGGTCQIWRTLDGSNWEPINTDGFGDPNNISMSGWATLGGYLYGGTLNDVTGAQLWRTNNGTDWDPVIQNGFVISII